MSKLSWATKWVQKMTTTESLETKVDFKCHNSICNLNCTEPHLLVLTFLCGQIKGQANVFDTIVVLNKMQLTQLVLPTCQKCTSFLTCALFSLAKELKEIIQGVLTNPESNPAIQDRACSIKQQSSQLGYDCFNSYCISPSSVQSSGGLMCQITVIYPNDTGFTGS